MVVDEWVGAVLESDACCEAVGFVVFIMELGVFVRNLLFDVKVGDFAVKTDEFAGDLQPFGVVSCEYLGLQFSL